MTALLSSMFYASADHSSILKSDKYNALLQVQTSCLCSCGCAALSALFRSSIEISICCYQSYHLFKSASFSFSFLQLVFLPHSPSILFAPPPFHLTCSSPLPSHLLPSPTISLALPPFFPISQSNRTFCDFRSVQRLSGCLHACTLCVLFVRTCDFCGGALSHFLRHRLNDPTVRFSTNFVFPLIGPFEGP
jgi:hypothetical protein